MKREPRRQKYFQILSEYGTPKHVINHCNAVSLVAESIANALVAKGVEIDVDLVVASASLHDIARKEESHEEVGADYLESIGLDDVASIVRMHTKHRFTHPPHKIDELDVLCIADRLVLQDRYSGVKPRMEYIKKKAIRRFGYEVSEQMDRIIYKFEKYLEELEEFLGKSIDDIVRLEIGRVNEKARKY